MRRSILLVLVYALLLFLVSYTLVGQVSFFQPLANPCWPQSPFVADFNGDGKPDLLCSGTVYLGKGDGTFSPGMAITGTALAVADFNGDGKPDVLEQSTGTLLVLLGNGDGTFQSPVSTPSGASLQVVASADLNGDGKADVVGFYNSNSNIVLFAYLSKGDGSFASGIQYTFDANAAAGQPLLSLEDVNGDGRVDLLFSAPGQEIVLLGQGDGTFGSPIYSAGVTAPVAVAVADFNRDGKVDAAVTDSTCRASCGSPNGTYVLIGNGDGSFQPPSAALPVTLGGALAAADVNGDGNPDLLVQSDFDVVQVYLSNGDGTFTNTNSYVAGVSQGGDQNVPGTSIPGVLVVADFNSDGKMDLVASTGLLLGNGDGTFEAVPLVVLNSRNTGGGNKGPLVGVFDKTKPPGVAVLADSDVDILSNNGLGQLSLAHTYPISNLVAASLLVAGDFNGDGNLDLIVTSDQSYNLLLGNGDGSFQSPVSYPQSLGSVVQAVDFNNDNKLDLLSTVPASGVSQGTVAVLLGNGDGTFASPVIYYAAGYVPFSVADFNSDGKLDIACIGGSVGGTPGQGLSFLFGNGDGTFQAAVFPSLSNGFTNAPFTADLNGDGKPDLVDFYGLVALGNGDGTFQFKTGISGSDDGTYAVADLNGDGKQDLLALRAYYSSVFPGNGDGSFGSPLAINGPFRRPVVIADMNKDGEPDIVFPVGTNVFGIAVQLNTTPPGFIFSATVLSPSSVIAGTFATSTVTAAPTFGFHSAVTLSCSGLPSGASCGFSPASISNSSGTSVVTITTGTSTQAGTYPVQVQGASGSIVNAVTLSLVVQAPPDFTMGPAPGSPSSQTISAGQTASFSLALSGTGSFTGKVNLSCSISPAVSLGPTCSVPSFVQISGGTQTANVQVATTKPTTTGAVPNIDLPPGTVPLVWTFTFLGLASLWLR